MATDDESRLDDVREQVLDRMERQQRIARLVLIAGALFIFWVISGALVLVDWSDRQLMILLFVANEMILCALMLALLSYLSRSIARILAALEASSR